MPKTTDENNRIVDDLFDDSDVMEPYDDNHPITDDDFIDIPTDPDAPPVPQPLNGDSNGTDTGTDSEGSKE